MAERQQMRAASIFYHGMFSRHEFFLPQNSNVYYKKDLPTGSFNQEELIHFMESDNDIVCSEINVCGQRYENGDLVVTRVDDCDSLSVGLIQAILVKRDNVYFLCKVYHCIRHWLRFFESHHCDEGHHFINSKKILDYKPLIKRGTIQKFVFFLHHRVSFVWWYVLFQHSIIISMAKSKLIQSIIISESYHVSQKIKTLPVFASLFRWEYRGLLWDRPWKQRISYEAQGRGRYLG